MDNLRSIFLSKNNVSQLYQTFMVAHKLMNADVARKTQVTNQLVATMNAIYNKIDKTRINSNNLPVIVAKFNDAVLKKLSESVNRPVTIQERMPDRMLYDNMTSKKDDMTPQERLQQLQALRDNDIPDMRKNRPPTPDFSIDGYGSQQKNTRQVPKNIPNIPPPNVQADDDDFLAFNGVDAENNLDMYDTGIDMNNFEEDNTPLDVRLKRLEQERGNINIPPPPKQQIEEFQQQRPPPQQRQQVRQVEVPPMATQIVRPKAAPRYQSPPQVSNDMVSIKEIEGILIEQKEHYETELAKLKQNQSDLIKLRVENEMLNRELARINEQGTLQSEQTQQKLQSKKQEILQELDKLQKKHDDMEILMSNNLDIERRIDKKKEQLQKLMNHLDTLDFMELLDSGNASYDENSYIYTISNVYDNVQGIEIGGFDIPMVPYNVNTSNNILYVDDEVITIPEGDYNIDSLIYKINCLTNRLQLTLDTISSTVMLESNFPLMLKRGDNCILDILGLMPTEAPITHHQGYRPYRLPRENVVRVYINDTHIATLSLTTKKIYNNHQLNVLGDTLSVNFKTGADKTVTHFMNHRLELVIRTKRELVI